MNLNQIEDLTALGKTAAIEAIFKGAEATEAVTTIIITIIILIDWKGSSWWLGFICDNVYCVSNVSFTLIISIETY